MVVTIEQKIDELATAVKVGFDAVEKRLTGLENGAKTIEGKVDNLPTKSYLDDKLADLEGHLNFENAQAKRQTRSFDWFFTRPSYSFRSGSDDTLGRI